LNDTSGEWSQNVWSLDDSSNILSSKQMSNEFINTNKNLLNRI